MAKMSPKDIDEIFQKGSERYDYEYNEDAWGHMESLLEKDDRRRFFWWIFGGVGAILIFGMIYYFYPKGNTIRIEVQPIEQSNIEKENFITEIQKEEAQLEAFEKETQESSNMENKNESINSRIDANLNTRYSENENSRIENNNGLTKSNFNSSENSFENNSSNKSKIVQESFSNNANNQQINNQINLESNSSNLFENKSIKVDTLNSKKEDDKIYWTPVAILKILNIEFDRAALPELDLSKELAVKFDTLNLNSKNGEGEGGSAFLIGGMIGTEFSAIGTDKVSKQELKFGGQIEYRFNKKYSANIGVTYIRKDYSAGSDDYKPGPGYWEDGIAPEKTYAHCDMLEIPVKLSYFFKGYTKDGFYSSIGLTSYLMRNERYYYHYEIETPTQRKFWMGSNENNHWFGMGNVSIGYQHILNSKCSIQIEPYAEIPITRIGHGKIRLWSFGISGKFNFHIK